MNPTQMAESRRDHSTSYHEWLSEQSIIPGHRANRVRGLSPTSQVYTLPWSQLRRFRKAARDYGHLDHFLRESDEAFADEMAATYGISRIPMPLMIPLGVGYLPVYAPCWDSYHRGLITIMQRVARRTGVDNTLPTMYIEVTGFDPLEDMGEDNVYEGVSEYARDTDMAYDLPSRAVWSQISTAVHSSSYGTRIEANARGGPVYLQ
jgi:hypothetical protein